MADRISSSKNEIYTSLLDIGTKYISDGLKNTDFLTTSQAGWWMEIMAYMMKNSTTHKSLLYNENWLNTAVIPRSVYNFAKQFDVAIQKAEPAYAEVSIIINKNILDDLLDSNISYDIERFGSDINQGYNTDTKSGIVILDKEDPIIAGEYYFMLEHSILIRKNTKTKSYTARYIQSEYTSTEYQDLNGNYSLRVRNINDNNIVIYARVYQYKRQVFTTQIVNNDFLNKVKKYTFSDQFCGLKLFYSRNTSTSKIEVPLVYSELDSYSEKYALYNLNDENELEIIFRVGDQYFNPDSNSNIHVYIYTTLGSEVPSAFSGDAIMNISNVDLKSLPIIIQFNPTNIIGGTNAPTIYELKKRILNEITTSKTIVTQSDLENYFNKLRILFSDINSGKIKFIKRRDDVIRRVFDSYVLLRDNTDDSKVNIRNRNNTYISPCIPTNSYDVYFGNENMNMFNDKPTTYSCPKFTRDLSETSKEIYEYTENATNDYYFCPFDIYVYRGSYTFAKFIYSLTNSDSSITSNDTELEINNENHYLIPSSANLFRTFNSDNSLTPEDHYILTLTLNSDIALNNIDINANITGLKSNSNISIPKESIVIKSEQLSEDNYENKIEIRIDVNMDDPFDYKKNYEFIKLSEDHEFRDSEKLRIQLTISDNTFTYQTVEPMVFFESLDDILSPDIVSYKSGNNVILGLSKLPVVHSSFLTTSNTESNIEMSIKKDGLMKQLFTYINQLKNSTSLLETSTAFNLKFYNTYGTSKLYTTPNTNVKVDFEIVLSDYCINSTYKESIKAEMKSYIRRLFDVMNEKIEGIDIYSLGNALRDNSTYGKYIKQINYSGLASSLEATINKIDLQDSKEDDYVPEWLNIDAEYFKDSIKFIED